MTRRTPPAAPKTKVPALPKLLDRKIYKTGQTRGADDDVIFQNRVLRNNTVLIPYALWDTASAPPPGETGFEKGFIALVSPTQYFGSAAITQEMADRGLTLGVNALVLYETRAQWNANNPDRLGWTAATQRTNPLGGEYAARVPATTGEGGDKIIRGFDTTNPKGAGIRIYEYAAAQTIIKCCLQLEFLFWRCRDAAEVLPAYGMAAADITIRREANALKCAELGLDNLAWLAERRLLSPNGQTMCPLCLEEVSAHGFFSKVEQAEGRVVPDLTVTQLNLFHIDELRIGVFEHRPYNLGWGHHHCNVVVKDAGIVPTVTWMAEVVDRNLVAGYLVKGEGQGIVPTGKLELEADGDPLS